MKVDKRPGSAVTKIHIEDDGSYFQVDQVRHERLRCTFYLPHLVMNVMTLRLATSSPVLSYWSYSLTTMGARTRVPGESEWVPKPNSEFGFFSEGLFCRDVDPISVLVV